MDYRISKEDGQILRELAKKQLEFHHREENQRRIKEWYAHNALQGQRPMIHLEAGTFQQEFLPDRLRCTGEFARQVEQQLYENFQNQELFDDDRVTPDWFGVNYDTFFRLFDIQIHVQHTEMGGHESVGHHFVSVVEDLEDDYDKLKPTAFGVDKESTRAKFESISQTIGDILPVRMKMDCLYSVPTQMVVHFMSMENMMFNMYDYPELFKEMMDRIAEDTLAYYRMLEKEHLILPTVSYEGVGQGTWALPTSCPAMMRSEREYSRPKMCGDSWIPRKRWGFLPRCMRNSFSPVIRKFRSSTACCPTAAVSRCIPSGTAASAS